MFKMIVSVDRDAYREENKTITGSLKSHFSTKVVLNIENAFMNLFFHVVCD